VARRLLAALACLAVTASLAAWELPSYVEIVRLQADGSRTVTLLLDVPGGAPVEFRLPLAHAKAQVVGVAPEGTIARITQDGGSAELVLENVQGAAQVQVRLAVPPEPPKVGGWGSRSVAHELVNTTRVAIAKYSVEVLLPDGFGVGAVDGTTPESNSSGKGPWQLVRDGSRRGVKLDADGLTAGAHASVRLRYRPSTRSPLLAGVLGLLAAAYLVGFRDLVRGRGRPGGGNGA
jgi:hypothetical protein